jgi:hypothetical protein
MKHLFVTTLLLVYGCAVAPRTAEQTISPCGIELYHSLGGFGPEVATVFKEANFKRVILINQRRIVNKNDAWLMDPEILKANVLRAIPDPESKAYVVLNWEGPAYLAIQKGPKAEGYERASQQFIAAYKLVKSLRPGTKVGYYGFPIRKYFKRNEAWRTKNRSLDRFLSSFDVLYPSLYDFYDSSTYRGKKDLNYVRENTEEFIQAGLRLNKPVMPFVWHRYHTSNKKRSLDLIPINEFTAHVGAAAGARVEDKKIDGLVWWSSEFSNFAKANRGQYADKKLLRLAYNRESAAILPGYFSALKTAVNQGCDK